MAESSFRPPKQWQLSENETINSFANWQSNIMYHLSLNNDFETFLTTEWRKKSVTNRGLEAAGGKTAVQRNIILERMLGLIAQFVPTLLRNDIIKKSTSLNSIWQRIRKHYSFSQSEVNFLKLSTIKRKPDERYETFYQRIVAHLEDNLLTSTSGLTHDGQAVTEDEEMSPTVERLAVYLWLTLIDDRLPAYVARIYAHDLQTKSLKDIQPQLADSMDSLIADLSVQEEISISYASSRKKQHRNTFRSNRAGDNQFPPVNSQDSNNICAICKAAGRNSKGHSVKNCWFLSKFDKLQIAKAFQVDVDDELIPDSDNDQASPIQHIDSIASDVHKVQCDVSPYFYAFYRHRPIHIVLDTGATSSLISKSFASAAGIRIAPTRHSARAVDKSSLKIHGEVQITLQFSKYSLPLTALVVDTLDCDVLAGVPFCRENDVQVHLKNEHIMINDIKIPYGGKLPPQCSDIYRTESLILRSDSAKFILPGEFLEFSSDSLKDFDGEVAIEPHSTSPLDGSWPIPEISRVIDGTVRIQNPTNDVIPLSALQHFAQIRRVIIPSNDPIIPIQTVNSKPTVLPLHTNEIPTNFSDPVAVDPDCQLSSSDKQRFRDLNQQFDSVFNPDFGAYNDYSGSIRAKVNFGPVKPPPQKGKLPFYNQTNLQLLQEEADKLEALGVLAKPEDVGVDVVYVSPSFLVKKPNGGYRLVTAFNNLDQYTRLPPTASVSCNDVLRRLSSWKYIIKSDLTKSFFQIRVAKNSIQYLGTVTPFKGIRVYLRSAMGMPGSSEYLQELTSRVFGDFLQEGFMVIIHDDLYIFGNTVDESINNWSRVLQRMQLNNLHLSATKTAICPLKTTILGWIWQGGTLSPCPHKIAPLVAVEPPPTCSSMRSFIGAFKALSKCIPRYATLVAPLEDAIKGLQGQQHVNWTDELTNHFLQCKQALQSPTTITIPKPSDHLALTVDASPKNSGIGGTLFIQNDNARKIAGFFSFKLKEHQRNWFPCELEALAISASVNYFSPYIRESHHCLQVLTDNKPCVEAFTKLCNGQFSASSRISTFLTTLSSYNVTLTHINGKSNQSSDFGSRNPITCNNSSCQICDFVQSTIESVVQSVTDIITGTSPMPFLNHSAWRSAQQNCPDLRRTFTHLSQGTRPPRKARRVTDIRRYLRISTITDTGLLVVLKSDPYIH